MITGAAYIRVSTADQTEYSPDSQIRLIMEYASRNGIVIPERFIFRDEGISGRYTDKRVSFNNMIAKARQREFSVILVYSTSRFARNLEDSIVYKSMLQREYDIEVVSITQPSVDRKTDMLTNAIYAVMDEWYSLDLSDNVKRGMTQKALSGGTQTPPPFGYDLPHKGAVFTINEKEAGVVKYIFEQFISGASKWHIAHSLNNMGVLTKRGNKITTRSVYYILRNITYTGYSRWTPVKRAHWDFNCPDTIIAEAKHMPIIDRQIFAKVQKILDEQLQKKISSEKPREIKAHWLSGVIKCGMCGSSLVYNGVTKTRKSPFFRCGGYGKGYCVKMNFITVKEAETLVLNYFSGIFCGVDIGYAVENAVSVDYINESKLLKSRLQALDKKLSRAKEAFLNEIIDVDEFNSIKDEINNDKKGVTERLNGMSDNSTEHIRSKVIANLYGILTDNVFGKEEKHTAFRSVVKSITFDKSEGKFQILFYK